VRAFAAAVALALLPLAATAQPALLPVRVLANVGGDGTAVPSYGAALGAFKREGLDVSVSGSGGGGRMIAALVGGSAEIAFSNVVSAVAAIQRGIPIVILVPAVVVTSKTPDILLVKVRGSTLKTGADLTGKIVGVPTLDGELQLGASLWIDKNGGNAKSVHFVEVPSSAMTAVLKQGRVDAAMMGQPFLAMAKGDVVELGDALGAISPQFVDSVFVASKPWLEAHPDAARRFVRVMVQTAHWANGHHAETAAILSQAAGIDLAIVNAMVRDVYAETLDAALMQPAIDAATKYGTLKETVDMRRLIADAQPYW
jgi:NitT/TauT family transport system substrate-binding protein